MTPHILAWADTTLKLQEAPDELKAAVSHYVGEVVSARDIDGSEHERAHQKIKRIKPGIATLERERESNGSASRISQWR